VVRRPKDCTSDWWIEPDKASTEVGTMEVPTIVTFRGLPHTEWIEQDIQKRAARLCRYSDQIVSCHAVVAVPHRHHAEGNRFSVRIDLRVRGEALAVSRESNLHAVGQDLGARAWMKQFDIDGMRKHVGLVIREAFDAARRQLQDYARKRRLAVKTHTSRRRVSAPSSGAATRANGR
jgi:hypothetical protein